MLGDLLADDASFAHEERESAFRKVVCFDRFDDESAHDFGGADVRVVGHHDDWTASGEGRRGVATGDGVGEGEVARAEDSDGADRTEQGAMVRLRQRLAVRIRGFDTCVDPIAFLDEVGEEAELAHRATDLSLATGFGQAGFLGGAGDEGGRGGFDAGGDVAEEGGLQLSRKRSEGRGGQGGQGAGLIGLGGRGREEVRLEDGSRCRVDCSVGGGGGLTARETDERVAEEGRHGERG